MGASAIYQQATKTKADVVNGDYVLSFTLWEAADPKQSVIVDINLMAIKDQLYDYMFEVIFSIFPFAKAAVTMPEEPVFMS